MFRGYKTSIAFISSVFLIFLVTLYLTTPDPPSLLRYRRKAGPFPGYKDCLPATQVAFLHHDLGKNIRVIKNILERFASTHKLSLKSGAVSGCTGLFIGIDLEPDSVDTGMCSVELVRKVIGDEPVIVTAVGPAENRETNNHSVNETFEKLDEVIDLTLVLDKLPESLIVLKHLLCLDYRDIVYIDTDSGADGFPPSDSEIYIHFARKLQKIFEELDEDIIAREVVILKNANENLKTKCNETKPKRYAGIVEAGAVDLCQLMKSKSAELI